MNKWAALAFLGAGALFVAYRLTDRVVDTQAAAVDEGERRLQLLILRDEVPAYTDADPRYPLGADLYTGDDISVTGVSRPLIERQRLEAFIRDNPDSPEAQEKRARIAARRSDPTSVANPNSEANRAYRARIDEIWGIT